MSFFSNILGKYITSKNIKANELAQYCGLERSFMYKIIKGSRTPSSLDTIIHIAEYLRLTPKEKEEFIEAYKISTEGYENYFRRKEVLELFENFEKYSAIGRPQPYEPSASLSDLPETLSITGKNEIRHLLFQILFWESQKDSAHIRLLIQPDSSFLMELLASLGYENPNLRIDHIICFNTDEQMREDRKNYNLTCLKQLFPLYSCACLYNAYYYYGTLLDNMGDLLLFPYLVLTSTHAFLLTHDLQSGIIFQSADMISFFHKLYTNYMDHVSPLAIRMNNVLSQIQYFQLLTPIADHTFSFQMIPCFTYSLPEHFLERYIYQELPNRDIMISLITSHIRRNKARLSESPIYFIFSMDGIKKFLRTGRIPEYPDNIYRAIEPSDRLLLLKRFSRIAEPKYIKLLKTNIGNIDNELFMYVNSRCGYLMFPSAQTNQLICLNIAEPSLLYAFSDFCETMEDSLFYTEEETAAIFSEFFSLDTKDLPYL